MKMKKMFLAAFMTAVLMCGNTLFAQSNSYLNLGLNIPQGEFGSQASICALFNPVSTQGGAGLGANVGIKSIFNTKVKGLGIMLTLDGMYNGLQKEIKSHNQMGIPELAGLDVKTKNPSYINVPLMLGLNYELSLTNAIGLYVEGGVGANGRFILPYKKSTQAELFPGVTTNISYENHYTPKVAFAFQFGGGIMINKSLAIGVNYYNLGTSAVSGKVDNVLSNYLNQEFTYKELSTSMLIVRLGIRLQ